MTKREIKRSPYKNIFGEITHQVCEILKYFISRNEEEEERIFISKRRKRSWRLGMVPE